MSVTIEAIRARQTELAAMIQAFAEQATAVTHIEIEGTTIELQPGEHYAGAVLDQDGDHLHHLVLMAERPTDTLNWQAAMDWAQRIGGSIPSRQEQALLFANCNPHLEDGYHWSSETHANNASIAWICSFDFGGQGSGDEDNELSAVAVRRV